MQKKKKIIIASLASLGILGVIFSIFLIFKSGKIFSVTGEKENLLETQEIKRSYFSGMPCQNRDSRAFAVVLAQYPETMPLSGTSQVEIVIEGPVASPGGVTRLLALYQCQFPLEIGSIRSVRPYMADLALGFDAILASWGGAKTAIDRIKNLGLNWLDARVNPSSAFFRKKNIPAPHNGFTSLERLKIAAQILKMRETNQFLGYQFLKEEEIIFSKKEQKIKINYTYPVEYVYEPATGRYLRFWDGKGMIDRNTSKQVWANNVVLMKTKMGTLSSGVADVKVIGKGKAIIYKAGEETEGRWQKENSQGKLSFLDVAGAEIKFVPGPIWIEITQ